jgi:glycosyltransferase involved in cell wall biosynthesis
MRKIVLLSPAHPLRGGIAASTERLARELRKFGHEVVIFSFSLQYPRFLFPGKTQYTDDPPPEDLDIRTRVNSVNPLNWLSVGWEIRRLKPDAIITRFWLPFMGPCLGTILRIAKSRHTRTIAIADNIIPHEKRPGDTWFTNYFIGAIDAFVVMSKSVEAEVKTLCDKPVRYIPHPIYDNYGKPLPRALALRQMNLPEAAHYLLFFGFIRDYKGLDLLLQAMADPRIRRLPLKLIVAGEYYGNRDHYEEIIRVLEIENQLILKTDFIPTDEVRFYFCAADLVVQPYKSATQSGISQLAYHFDKPMVVTEVGGLPEIVPHGKAGYVVKPEAKAIADAIVDFFENKRLVQLTEGVRMEKHRFSWAAMVKGLEELG